MITAVFSQKGGVGKTTTAVHLVRAMASLNKKARPLLLDIDEQAASKLFSRKLKGVQVEVLMPLALAGAAEDAKGRATVIDCPPSLLSARPALALADVVLIPMQPEMASLSVTDEIIAEIAEEFPRARIRVLLTMWGNAPDMKQVKAEAQAAFGERFLPVSINRHHAVRRASMEGKTVFDYEPDSIPARQYLRVLRLLQEV